MKKRTLKRIKRIEKDALPFVAFVLSLIILSIILKYISPDEIVGLIGINNSYIALFILSFLGGISILFPFPYYLVVLTLAAGGLNPIVLGLCAGLGVVIGESTSYFIGYTGRDAIPEKINKYFSKFYKWIHTKPKWLMTIFLFVYGCIIPIPNDVIIIPLGLAKYPYWRVIIPLGLGNIIFNIMLATLGYYGFFSA